MKKLMTLLAALFISFGNAVYADNDKPITADQLPQKAQSFIKRYFPDEKISFAKMERDFLETKYQVVFTNSTKIEFLKNGDWKEIDCRYSAVPTEIIPAQIVQKVKELYPTASIVEIDRDKRDYEIKLSNRLELTFDLKFNLIDIDD